jgi:peptidoglycan/LPS O-acetylase OafA/YrhL
MGRVGYVDGWRAISALMVVFSHYLAPHLHDPRASEVLGQFAMMGVLFFFVISGYVITRSLMGEARRTGTISLPAFYLRRACRILPPLCLYLLVVTLLGRAGTIDHDLRSTFSALAFLCNTSLGGCGRYVGHTWSLAYEEQFYAIFPALFAWLVLRQRPSLALAIGGAIFLLPLAFPASWSIEALAKASICLLGGVLFALHGAQWDLRKWRPAFLLALGVVLVGPFIAEGRLATPLRLFGIPASLCVVLFYSPLTWANRLLTWGPLMYLGQISYSVYIWQQLALVPQPDPSAVLRALAALCVFPVAALSYRYLETPFMELGRRASRARIDLAASAKTS